jgi:hypothetical protein
MTHRKITKKEAMDLYGIDLDNLYNSDWVPFDKRHDDTHEQKKEHKQMPLDVLEVISIVEEGMMAQAKLSKRDGETDAKAFSRKYDTDIEFRKLDRSITEAKQLMAAAKSGNYPGLMSLEPIVVGGEDALASNDPVKAVAAYEALVDKQHNLARKNNPKATRTQAYDVVNRNPEYKVIVAAAFRRPDGSSPSGDALQNNRPGRG